MKLPSSIVILVFVNLYCCNAWLFGSSNDEQNAVHPVDDKCLEENSAGSCAFWDCFERRHPCQGFILERAKVNCLTLKEKTHLFNEQGKEFLKSSRSCLMRSFRGLYLADHLSCRNISAFGLRKIGDCSLEATPSICDVYWANKDHFTQGFDFNLTILKHIAKMFMKCGPSAAKQALRHFSETIGFPISLK